MVYESCRMEERCNQIIDCGDESDENNCKLIVFKDNYKRKVPPFTISKDDQSLIPAEVRVSTQLKNVLAISEFTHTIVLKIGITLKWYENRVLYHNLKNSEALNVLTDEEVTLKEFLVPNSMILDLMKSIITSLCSTTLNFVDNSM